MKQIHKIYSIAQVILFFALLSFGMANDLFHFHTPPRIFIMEKRPIREKPIIDIGNLDAFPRAYTSYFNDHFPYRTELIRYYSGSMFRFLHHTPFPDRVHFGNNGWMFLAEERPFYENRLNLADNIVDKVVAEIHLRATYYHGKGIKFFLAIPPIKPEIYPEFCPWNYVRQGGRTFTEMVTDRLKQDTLIRFVDLKSAELAARKYGQLYYKTDNHWNALGGYWGYRAVMDCMRKDFPQLVPLDTRDFTMEKKTIKGKNLTEIMNLSDFVTEEELVPHLKKGCSRAGKRQGYKPRQGFGYPEEFETVSEVDNPALPVLVVVRDSYFYGMMPYMVENFRKTVILYDTGVYGIFDDAIRTENPNLVLYLIYESHLPNLAGKYF